MSRWFRFYDDAMHDAKLLRLSDATFRAWMTLLCVASKHDGVLPPAEEIAITLRCKPALVAGWIAELVSAGLIDKTELGFSPHNWSERQYKSDSSAERMKRHRDKKRDVTPTVTSDVTVTVQNRTETEQNRTDARDDVQKRVGDFCQAVVRTYAECNSTVLPETSRCTIWLSQGYDPEVCLAVIAQILVRKPSIASLSYFDQPIADAHAKKAPPRKALVEGPVVIDWDSAVKQWLTIKRWPKGCGNDPDSPACRAPPEILRKHGIQPTGASHV
jgi:hypothetical protein